MSETDANKIGAVKAKLNIPLPCPFCGGTKLDASEAPASSFGGYIVCKTCDTYGPEARTNETALEAWNRRA